MEQIDCLEHEERLHEVVADYLDAVDAGQAPDRQELVARHPDLADELRAFFAEQDRMDRLAEPLRPVAQAARLAAVDTGTPQGTLHETAGAGAATWPRSFGEYELLEVIAEGGMGVVYKARQKSLHRLVALKMILAGPHASRADVQRFRNEAETAAQLDHPRIVPIYEVGEHDGQVYFSMKLIEGENLAEHQGRFRTDPRATARLLAAVARAVQHAHQRGVLHRDLKPANILLDQDEQPLVTDFGLAKHLAIAGGEARPASLTQSGALLGTPSYMAPEQLSGRKGAVTTATDVYGLGAVLYYLLTCRAPFRGETPLDILDQVKHSEPVPPGRVNPKIDRDLETICLKCLEKQPERRYESAAALADDLDRCLKGEPIEARPVGRLEKAWRWCRRNPIQAILTGAVATLLLLGFLGLTVAYIQIAHARDAEAEAREKSEQYLRHLLAAADQYFTKVSESQELKALPTDGLRRDLFRQAQLFYKRVIDECGDDPRVRVELARAYYRLAGITSTIDSKAEALALYQHSQALFEQLVEEQPGIASHEQFRAECLLNMGNLYCDTGDLDKAEAPLLKAEAISEHLIQADPDDASSRQLLARAHARVGRLHRANRQTAQAEAARTKARDIYERLVRDYPKVPAYRQELAEVYSDLSNVYHDFGRLDQALAALGRAREIVDQLVQDYPTVAAFRYDLASTCYTVGYLWYRSLEGKPAAEDTRRKAMAAAESAHRQAVVQGEKLVRDHPRVLAYQQLLAKSLGSLGLVCSATNRPKQAEAAYRQIQGIQEQLVRDNPTVLEFTYNLAVTYVNLGNLLDDSEQLQAKVEWYGKAIRQFELVLKQYSRHALTRQFLCEACVLRARLLGQAGRHGEAIPDWSRAIDLAGEAEVNAFRIARAMTRARLGEHGRATDEADAVPAKALTDTVSHDMARVYALSAAAVLKDAKPPSADQTRLAAHYATRAVELLSKAQRVGFFKDRGKIDQLKKDTDFDPLRQRADFKRFLTELGVKAVAEADNELR